MGEKKMLGTADLGKTVKTSVRYLSQDISWALPEYKPELLLFKSLSKI
jgi:hypothetical protein